MAGLDSLSIDESLRSLRDDLISGGNQCATEVSVGPLGLLTGADLADWQELARHAAEPNCFQEPDFVLPLADVGLVAEALDILVVKDSHSGRWLAACVFQDCGPSMTRPLPHLRSLSSPYSFLDTPLVHRDHLDRALRAALSYLQNQRTWHGVRFRVQKANGPQADAWNRQARSHALSTDCDHSWQRAATSLAEIRTEPLLSRCSRSRRKSLLRARRALEAVGPVSHRLVVPETGEHDACDTFLALEAMGWKGEQGTAICSRPADFRFFRGMVDRFARRGNVIFGELLVGDRVIASTCNLVSGPVVFAFKLGWDPEFAKGNPGHWAELELAAALATERPDLQWIDSCSQPGSYVESVSTQTQTMESAVYVWSRRASALCEIRRQVRAFKSSWRASSSDAPALPAAAD